MHVNVPEKSARLSRYIHARLRKGRNGVRQGSVPDLSTFMGHVHPASTAVYLTVTAELLQEANERFNHFAAPLLKEVAR